jgi:hypothetical protein
MPVVARRATKMTTLNPRYRIIIDWIVDLDENTIEFYALDFINTFRTEVPMKFL